MEDIFEKTVFITGSGRGIGKAIALLFAANDYNVVINSVKDGESLAKTEETIRKYNKNVLALMGDMSDYMTAEKAFAAIIKKFGGIDILVNNAGISYIGLFNTMREKQWKNVMENNFYSVLNCSHLALKYMVPKHRGNIINISSMWGEKGASCEAVYSASKGAVNSFTKALAKELAPSNIRVNAISCGAIDTDMNSFLSEEEKQTLCEEIPMGKFGTANDVAETALFLAEDKSGYITGQIIGVDGGMI